VVDRGKGCSFREQLGAAGHLTPLWSNGKVLIVEGSIRRGAQRASKVNK
jgi:hypothetical protein